MTIRQCSEIDREKEERCPMTDDSKSAENRRMKLLKQQPITDDVLDIVAHGREQANQKISPIVAMVQRRKRDLFLQLDRCRWNLLTCHFKRTSNDGSLHNSIRSGEREDLLCVTPASQLSYTLPDVGPA